MVFFHAKKKLHKMCSYTHKIHICLPFSEKLCYYSFFLKSKKQDARLEDLYPFQTKPNLLMSQETTFLMPQNLSFLMLQKLSFSTSQKVRLLMSQKVEFLISHKLNFLMSQKLIILMSQKWRFNSHEN